MLGHNLCEKMKIKKKQENICALFSTWGNRKPADSAMKHENMQKITP